MMLLSRLRKLRHGPLRGLGPLWVRLGNIYRLMITGMGLSVNQKIGSYGPFRLDAQFTFSNFENWGGAHNDGFVACVEACRGCHCVIDIGAHIGLVSLPVASVMDRAGLLVSFEPSTANRGLLERHLEMNGLENRVRVESSLVGPDSREDTLFHEMDNVSGMNSLALRGEDYRQVRRPQVKLDEYCEMNSLVPEVIKIDVEGAELGVLEGAQKIIERYRPIVFLSVHPWHIEQLGRTTEELKEIIANMGYECRHSDGSTVTDFALKEYILTHQQSL